MDFKRIKLDMKMQAEQIKIYNVNSCYRGAFPGELDDIRYNFEILESLDRTKEIMELVQMENLDKYKKGILKGLIEKNNDLVYSDGDTWVGSDILEHEIELTTERPVFSKIYDYPHKLRGEI